MPDPLLNGLTVLLVPVGFLVGEGPAAGEVPAVASREVASLPPKLEASLVGESVHRPACGYALGMEAPSSESRK